MNKKLIVTGTLGIVGAGGYICNKIYNKIVEKRAEEIDAIQREWWNAGYDSGYKNGIEDEKHDTFIRKHRGEV